MTQSDPGSENYGVVNVHTLACHELDLMLSSTLQHCWKQKKNNIKSEANWCKCEEEPACMCNHVTIM